MNSPGSLFNFIKEDTKYEILNKESLSVLKTLRDNKFDLIITSPPYNIGKAYETKTSIEKYLESQEIIIKELVRLISTQGSLCWQFGNYIDKGDRKQRLIFHGGVV
mgnify:CR=1 FL=1